MNIPLLQISIKGPDREQFKGEALSVTSVNKVGKFDVLPYHSNFISLIKDYVTIRQKDNKKITFPLQSGIMKVHEDNIHILIGV